MNASDPPSHNLFASPSDVSASRRAAVARQQGCVLWFSGLSGSGKSTIARALESALIDAGRLPFVLDGDNLRLGLNRDLGFSESDRVENLRRVAEVARLMADAALIVITAFISPLRTSRQTARDIIGAERFFEVHVSTSLATCEARDIKGLYRKAREGKNRRLHRHQFALRAAGIARHRHPHRNDRGVRGGAPADRDVGTPRRFLHRRARVDRLKTRRVRSAPPAGCGP